MNALGNKLRNTTDSIGGAMGESWGQRRGLCPGCAATRKTSLFHSVLQHQLFAFHSTILHTKSPTEANFLTLMAPEGRILKANFQKNFRGDNPGSPLRNGATASCTHHQHGLRGEQAPRARIRPSCPLKSYGAPQCAHPIRTRLV